jgi:Tol biopolymer transport system component
VSWAEQAPAWSAGGGHLALASNPNGNFDVYVSDLADDLGAGAPDAR